MTILLLFAILVAHLVQPSHQIDYNNPVRSAADDEVKNLPGLQDTINFKQYSGYLNADNAKEKFFHYWFVESQSNPATDPVILWLTGGPGCSSLEAFLTELGPFRVNNDGMTLSMNDYSWNKVANVLFLESPSGVGFSYAKTRVDSNDDTTSLENYMSLKSFFTKFPQFKNNSLYLTGESYAGVYLPTLGVRVNQDMEMNLKGIAIGNGYLDSNLLTASSVFFSYYHGFAGKNAWNELSKHCCGGRPPARNTCTLAGKKSEACGSAMDHVTAPLDDGLNPYNIYANCDSVPESIRKHLTRDIVGKRLKKATKVGSQLSTRANLTLGEEPPCLDTIPIINYFNKLSVRDAIHVPLKVREWDICGSIGYDMQYPQKKRGMTPQIMELINSKRNLNLMVYNGDVDSVCNFLADEWFVDDLERKVIKNHSMWYADNQIAGFTKKYDGITFTTVKGAGHMVASDKPLEALEMFKKFLKSDF